MPASRACVPTSRWNSGPLVPDFSHVAEDQPARRRRRGEYVDRDPHRIRVRVVGVVEDRGARAGAQRDEAARDRTKRLEAAHDGGQRYAHRQRRRGCGQRIRHIVASRRREPGHGIAGGCGERDGAASGRELAAQTDRRRMIEREIEHAHAAPRARGGTPHVDAGVVGIQHRGAAGGQCAL